LCVSAAVIHADGRVLAIRRRDNNHWEPPGGVLELEESIHDGLVREVREETGVTVHPGHLTRVYKNMPHGVVALVFRCTPIDGPPTASEEAAEVRWLQPDEIGKRMDEAYAIRMVDALRKQSPAIRHHDGTGLL
jgi:8-oxo-dGTP diphosphatase